MVALDTSLTTACLVGTEGKGMVKIELIQRGQLQVETVRRHLPIKVKVVLEFLALVVKKVAILRAKTAHVDKGPNVHTQVGLVLLVWMLG
jgi:hypothetical protein